MVTDEMVGKAAVAMCKQAGFDPYERMPNDGPRWKYYMESARAALEAALSAAEPWPFERQNYNCPCIHPSQCDKSCVKKPAPSVAVKVKQLEWGPDRTAKVLGATWMVWPYSDPLNDGLGNWLWQVVDAHPHASGRLHTEEAAKAACQADCQSRYAALSAQVQDVAGTVEAFDRDHPELYWHLAKGKITAGEPLYGAIITDIRGNELGDGESNICAIDAFNIAVDDAALPAAPAKQEG